MLSVFVLSAFGQKITGTYKRIGTYPGDLKLTEFKKNKQRLLKFEINAFGGKSAPCIGQVSGFAKFINSNLAEYHPQNLNEYGEPNNCRLTFIISKGTITIRESDCGYFHGAACSFEGGFKRNK